MEMAMPMAKIKKLNKKVVLWVLTIVIVIEQMKDLFNNKGQS
jgi:hypothetical protein